MNSTWLRLALAFGLLFLALTLVAERAEGQAPVVPDALVLRFDASAAQLDQPSIRAAIAQELAMTLANEGSDQAATLLVSVTTDGDVQVAYRPARDVLTRTVPVTSTSDVPRLVAHLAGNLVRNEAGALLAELRPEPAPTTANSEPPAGTRPQAVTRSSATTPATQPATTATGDASAAPYLHDAWIFSVMAAIHIGQREVPPAGPAYLQLTLQQSKRIGDLEVAISARIAYGALDVLSITHETTGNVFDDVSTGVQVTVPVSIEYRVLEGKRSYLQLGASVGLQTAGILNGDDSATSGSGINATFGVQATAGFALAQQHGLLLRVGWDFFPSTQTVPSGEYTYRLSPLQPGFNLGWQIGW